MAKSTPECDNQTEMENWKEEALELQQEFYEKLGDRRWDLIKDQERWALESKVGFAMFGEPKEEKDSEDMKMVQYRQDDAINNLSDLQLVSYYGAGMKVGYTSEQRKEIMRMCDIIYETSRGPDVLVAFLFVIGNSEHGSFIVPIFRVQNNSDNNDYFIDNIGRVYKNWNDYKENNKLPPSEIYYPANGIYDSDEYGNVLVEFTESPASSVTSKALSVGDTGVGITSIILAGAGLVSIIFPPAAPVAAAVGWASAGCGVYGVGRGSFFLYDRKAHAQSISLADSEARNCWLSVLGSALGVGSGLAMKGMVNAVAQGHVVGTAGRVIVDMLNFGSLTVNGIGIANNLANLVEKKNKNELTPLDVLQFTTSVLFFTNAAMNAKTASSVIDQVQKDSLSNFSSDLSKRRTRAFNKLVRKSGGDGTMEDRARIIKGITNVGNKDEFFRMTIRAQKQSSSTVLNGEGKFVVNGNAYVDTDIKLQTHVKNIPTVTVSSTTPYTQNRLVYDTTVGMSQLIEMICIKHKKEFITLVDGVKIAMKDLYSFFEKLFKKYFFSKEKCTFPSNEIINFINNSETFAQSKGCKTKEDYIDFVHFLFIYEKSKLKEMEKNYQREKDNARKLLGEEFDESVFAQKWGIEDVNNREGSFLKIINDEIKESNKELKEQYEKCEIEIPAINEDGGLKFKSKYHALNVYYHFLVIDGEELTPSQFFSLIRRIVLRNNINKLTHDVDRNSRIITYIAEEGILVNVEECEDERFFKSVSIFK